MVLVFIALVGVAGGMLWFWKGPVARSAGSLRDDGSSKTEAYVILVLLAPVMGAAVYFLVRVGGD